MFSTRNAKVFAIGFNKCGTSSLTHLFKASGYRSSHNNYKTWYGRNIKIATRMYENLAQDRKLLQGIHHSTFYSDMEQNDEHQNQSGFFLFRELERQYPESKFILNVRKKENWIKSRSNHRNGLYLKQFMRHSNLDSREKVQELWSMQWDKHTSEVTEYFSDKPGKLITFDIEAGDINKLCSFFPELHLNPRHWGIHNRNDMLHSTKCHSSVDPNTR